MRRGVLIIALVAVATGCGGSGSKGADHKKNSKRPVVGGPAAEFAVGLRRHLGRQEFGALWQSLHPAHKRLFRDQGTLAACLAESQDQVYGSPNAPARAAALRPQRWRIPGTRLVVPTQAVRMQLLNPLHQSSVIDSWTEHVLKINGRWFWIAQPREVDSLKQGFC